jgi:diguanylate cyclase (GGDEF)-like protein
MIEIPGSLQNRLKSCQTLPSVPAVAIKFIDLCKKDDIGIPEIASVLAHDPALAASVLKVANSALYGVRSPVTTLERAISILGINASMTLALRSTVVGKLRRSNRGGFDQLTYWRRSVITAATARAICTLYGEEGGDEFFLAGLMLDIGMLALDEALPEEYGAVVAGAEMNHEKLVVLEREKFDVDHGAIGGWLLQQWNLPGNLSMAVAASHNPETATDPALQDLCRKVAFAGHFAGIWNLPNVAEATLEARRKAQEDLAMTAAQFEQLLNEVARSLPEITANLHIRIGSEEALGNLFNQARKALLPPGLKADEQVPLAQDLGEYDGLTSLHNRRYLEEVLPPLLDVAARQGQPLSVIFIDVDHFKKINDTRGKQAGDQVLVSIAEILRSAVRASDIAARYGEDEFLCVLPYTSEPNAGVVAERIRKAIASTPVKSDATDEIRITASLGYAAFSSGRPFASANHLLQEARRCLGAAKQAGNNRVMHPGAKSAGAFTLAK